MSKLSPKERVFAAMEKETLDRPPVSIFTQSSTITQMETLGIFYPEAHTNAEKMAKLASAQADLFGFESVRTPFCVSVEAENFGCKVELSADNSPLIREVPYQFDPFSGELVGEERLNLDPDTFLVSGRVPTVLRSVELLAKTHGEQYPVIAGVSGPFTTLGQMIGIEQLMMASVLCPQRLEELVKLITPSFKAYIQSLADAGADIITMAEGLGSSNMIEPSLFPQLIGQHLDCLTSVKGAYSVLHTCGDARLILEMMADTGVDGISLENAVDPHVAVEMVGKRTVLIGNIGTVGPLMLGTPVSVALAAQNCLEAGFDIIAPGCGLPLSTPNENLEALVAAVKKQGDAN